jgi:hypothetical protein
MENYDNLLSKLIFSDEATFHLSGKVNRHNVRVWGSENPHATLEVECDSPKINVQMVITMLFWKSFCMQFMDVKSVGDDFTGRTTTIRHTFLEDI